MKKPTAKIERSNEGNGLWLVLWNDTKDAMLPITEDEVQPIMQACIDWLVSNQKKPE